MIARLLPYRFWVPRTMVAGISAMEKRLQDCKTARLRVKLSLLVAVVFALLPCYLATLQPVHATSGINNTINFQGKVTNSNGTNVTDGTYDFVFKLYNGASSSSTNTFTESWTSASLWSSTMSSAPSSGGESLTYSSDTNESTIKAGQLLWNTTKKESVKVVAVNTTTNVITISPTKQAWSTGDTVTNKIYVQSGLFSVALNSLNQDAAWGTTDFNSDSVYLGINFNSDGEMKPRIQFTAVPYAKNAQKVNGLTVTNTSGNPTANGTTLKIADNKTVTFNNGLAFSGVDGKTVTFNNTLTLSGTDGSSIAFGTGGTVCYTATGCNQANTNTGSGTAGQLAFYTGTNTQSGSSNLYWDNTNLRLGIGTSSPNSLLNAKGTANVALSGTVSVTNGSPNVTGTSTSFTSQIEAGSAISIGGTVYTVSSITDATHLVLTANYGGTTTSGLTAYKDPSLFEADNGAGVAVASIGRSGGLWLATTGTVPWAMTLRRSDLGATDDVNFFNDAGTYEIWNAAGNAMNFSLTQAGAGTFRAGLTATSYSGLSITTATSTSANFTKSGDGVGGLMYSSAADTWSYLARGSNGQCLTSNSTTITWGACGNTIMSQGSGFAYLTSSSDGVVFGGSTTTAGDFWFDTANANLYLGVDALKNGGLTFRSSGSSITDASITTNSVGDLILSAPSGQVALGSGTGNITMSLTNATDLFKADKTLTLSGALSSTDFTYTRNLTAGANAAGGAVFKINDTSTGSSTINPDMLVVDAHPASGTFSGNLLRLENGGTDKFVVNSSGNVTTGGTYNGLTISSTTGTLTLASGKTLTVNNSLTFSGTDSTSFTLPTTGGNLATSAATSTQIAFSTGTGTLSGDSNLTWDNTNKRLGVGGTPTDALDVNGLIRVRNPQGETAAPTRANNGEFAFANVSSTQRLYFQANGTASYVNASGAGDYSEFFLKTYPQESLVPGMVIGAEQGNVTKTTRHQTALGVVSAYGTRNFDDNADGQRGDDSRYVNVGLLGQLPVIVSTEQGTIAAGDQLGTNSLFQGVAAHFTSDDSAVVGMAQQTFNPDTTQCQAASSLEAIAWPNLANNQLPDNNQCFRLPNNVIVGKVMAYIHPASTGLTAPTPTISSSSQLALQQLSAGANGLTIATNLTVNGDLTVSGNLTVSKGLAVGGPAEFQGPAIFKAVADFFDSVVFHKDATFQQNVSFAKSPTFNHDTAGSAIIRLGMQSVHVTFEQPFATPPVISTTLNSGPLRTDSYQSYLNANICTVAEGPSGCETKLKAKLLSTDIHFAISNQDANGFTVELDKPAEQDLKFNWTAIQVQDPTEAVSTPTPTPTP